MTKPPHPSKCHSAARSTPKNRDGAAKNQGGGNKPVVTADAEEWGYWNSLEAFKLYEAVYLQKGIFPPKNMDYLSDEERYGWRHDIVTMAETDNLFMRLLSSLRADKNVGKEFREIEDNKKAAFRYIAKSTFIENWTKCKLRFHKKFQPRKQGMGRPKKIDPDILLRIAKECASQKKPYKEFLHAAAKEFGCTQGRVRELFPVKTAYRQLQNF